jgi:hypothetical protein
MVDLANKKFCYRVANVNFHTHIPKKYCLLFSGAQGKWQWNEMMIFQCSERSGGFNSCGKYFATAARIRARKMNLDLERFITCKAAMLPVTNPGDSNQASKYPIRESRL